MDILKKAKVLSDAGKYDSCGPKVCSADLQNNLGGVMTAKTEHKTCKMFKTLMTNSCSFDCNYCVNRAGCTKQKVAYKPDQLGNLMKFLQNKHDINGLFLSSGVAGDVDKTTEKMIEAVKIMREKKGFYGYIHFKVLPGTSKHLIQEAAKYSSRMSVNIEAPNKSALNEMSSTKEFKTDLLRRQAWISQLKLPAGQSTQVILNEFANDKEVLSMMKWEYEKIKLNRMYYSAFRPVTNTPFEKKLPENKRREVHLYNTDFLVRKYGFDYKEFLSIMDSGYLPNEDPKLALAKERFSDGRLDVSQASYEDLIRVPGIGLKSAEKIVNNKIKRTKDVKLLLGKRFIKASPFISVNGDKQMSLKVFKF